MRPSPVTPVVDARRARARVQTMLCTLLAVVLIILPAAASSATTAAVPQVPAAAAPSTPARAALLMDAATGAVLWQRNGHRPVLVASTTKMLTALVAEDAFQATQRLKVPEAAERVDGTRFGFQQGMRVGRDTLLATLLLTSANDAAETLAANYPRGRGAFLAAMQARCAQLGCTDSTWRDPAGLDAPGHKASAADLAVVARALLARPLLARLVATQHLKIRWNGRTQIITNHNKLVRFDAAKGLIGVKTGYTRKSGHTLVAAQRRGGRILIAVVLDSDTYYDDARKLLAWGFSVKSQPGAELLGLSARPGDPGRPRAPAPAVGPDGAASAAAAEPTRQPDDRSSWRDEPLPLAVGTGAVALLGTVLLVWRNRRRRSLRLFS